jgi:hypothetical protein
MRRTARGEYSERSVYVGDKARCMILCGDSILRMKHRRMTVLALELHNLLGEIGCGLDNGT